MKLFVATHEFMVINDQGKETRVLRGLVFAAYDISHLPRPTMSVDDWTNYYMEVEK